MLALIHLDRVDHRTEAQVDTMAAVLGGIEVAEILAGGARHQPALRFDKRDLLAELDEHGCRLKPDIAPADHDETLCMRQGRDQGIGIGTGADRVEAAGGRPGAGEGAGRAAAAQISLP